MEKKARETRVRKPAGFPNQDEAEPEYFKELF